MADHIDKTRNDHHEFEKGNLQDFKQDNPFLFFSEWYENAHEQNAADPHAVVLSTVDKTGQPSSRIVYMRELLEEGFIIYTNYLSRKGAEIGVNQKVAGLFYWEVLERQVRIEGEAVMVDAAISDDYFEGRPRLSKIGAWASEQSTEIESRSTLEERVKFFEEKFPNEVPRPPHWGGYLIVPNYFEFWQGRQGRLHDRLCYKLEEDKWLKYRIAP
jgi:pyridoxamine 5'-phosphate oxidase